MPLGDFSNMTARELHLFLVNHPENHSSPRVKARIEELEREMQALRNWMEYIKKEVFPDERRKPSFAKASRILGQALMPQPKRKKR